MTYGEHYVTYGVSRPCARCGMIHGPGGGIRESSLSRFKLMQLLTTIVFDKHVGVNLAGHQEPRMLGILITPLRTYAAQSGNWQQGNTQFLVNAQGQGYKSCPPRSHDGTGNMDVAGRPIAAGLYRSSNRIQQGGYAPGNCAAPRLIQQAILDHHAAGAKIKLDRCAMSEVMYKSNPTDVPQGARQDWVHGLTAFSCATCDQLVPLLLCNDRVWGQDNVLGFMKYV